jgi:CRISPR-associated endoribonuclease Cas6
MVHLKAVKAGEIKGSTGRGVHGFWYRHWEQADARVADWLHKQREVTPFTCSPLMGLPRHSRNGVVHVPNGHSAWFRVSTLIPTLTESLLKSWLPSLPIGSEIEIPKSSADPSGTQGIRWRVTGVSTTAEEHPWAGQTEYTQLASQRLFTTRPPAKWRIKFLTPTAFHGRTGHLPFPLPDSLISSWLRRWQAFAPIALPEDLPQMARQQVVVSGYNLKTVPMREGNRLTVGCVGNLSLRALNVHPATRAALDLLAAYAFYTGSGHRTTQGMGVTRRVD